MKYNIYCINTARLLLLITVVMISGCRGCNDQSDKGAAVDTTALNSLDTISGSADRADIADKADKSEITDTVTTNPISKDTVASQVPAKPRSADIPRKDPGILARIDEYLVSTPKFSVGANGGISQATVSVTNKLPKASFQKLILEVTILNSDNSLVTSDYYNMVNLEPGETKQVNIRDNPKGSKIVVHVVKVRSNELTNGESVVTGARYNL